ncbi:hypothetical protein M430DRAFT_40654 [Neofusicoccum parvum]|uniref:Uncharacterized protein n=2 Tax=Neofusicoccum TaxID=407951 RepID=A0ABR3SGN4_9PEZI|nr:putative transcription factor cmr1 protein [Neofusicoccum parvum UCRNP2]GME35358.1 hypothetical protein M430DRAFT_40654 [Neofusicoccum parvum]
MKWAGKDFRNVNDVDPIVLYGKDGQREWCKDYGHARLRLVQFRGQVSTAMVYDNFPIIDIFKYVSEDVVFGAMDNKLLPEDGTYYFYLRRIKTA